MDTSIAMMPLPTRELPSMTETDARNFLAANEKDELLVLNRTIWKEIGIRLSDTALFFPAPNSRIPIMFAKFMNRRKVTFVDPNEANVSTLIKLTADMKLSNVTVKLANHTKFPVADNAFDVVYSDLGFSSFVTRTGKVNEFESLAGEVSRAAKPGGKIAAFEENGAPVMYPCPPEIMAIRAKIDSPRADRLVMGRHVYSLFKKSGLKIIKLKGFSFFLTSDDKERMNAELSSRIATLDKSKDSLMSLHLTAQEIVKYQNWLGSQLKSDSFMLQFNYILAIAEK